MTEGYILGILGTVDLAGLLFLIVRAVSNGKDLAVIIFHLEKINGTMDDHEVRIRELE